MKDIAILEGEGGKGVGLVVNKEGYIVDIK